MGGDDLRGQLGSVFVRARSRWELRRGERTTRRDWAEAIGGLTGRTIDPSTISDWESGANEPKAGALLAALLLAGVTLDPVLEPSARDYLARLKELLPPE